MFMQGIWIMRCCLSKPISRLLKAVITLVNIRYLLLIIIEGLFLLPLDQGASLQRHTNQILRLWIIFHHGAIA